jgi:hypothetical protein
MRIVYIIIAFAAFYLAFFRGEPIAFAALLLIAVMVGTDLYLGIKCRVSLKCVRKRAIARRKNNIFITFRIKNESKTPILTAKVKIRCRHGKEVITKTVKSYIGPESYFDATIQLSSRHCNLITTEILSVSTKSLFFSFKQQVKTEPVRTVVIPEQNFQMFFTPPCREIENDLQNVPLNEYSDFRPFRDGDSLSRIHLPLLAKYDELFIKKFEHESREVIPQIEILCRPRWEDSDSSNDRTFGEAYIYAKVLRAKGFKVTITLDGFAASHKIECESDTADEAIAFIITLFFASRDKNYGKKLNNRNQLREALRKPFSNLR